jgi:membrane fusion protein, type I secretion system
MRSEGLVMTPGERAQHEERARHDDEPARRPGSEPRRDGVGPQGAALILELERLREAFDQKDANEPTRQAPRFARDDMRPPAGRQRARKPKRPRKSTMGRAIEACLEQLGFIAAPANGSKNTREPRVGTPPRRPQPGAVSLDGSIPMDLLKPPGREIPGLEKKRRPTPFDKTRSTIPQSKPINKPRSTIPQSPPINQPRSTFPQSPPMDKPRSAIPQSITIDHPRLNMDRSAPIEQPRLALPRPAGDVAASKTSIGHLIERGRVGVNAGVAFLANRDALANAPGDTLALRTGRAYENELRTGLRVLLVALALGGGWMALMPLAGAVVVPGNLVVQSNVKTIQHPTGGVVAEVPVRNGSRVNIGDLLVRLDATQAQASLQMVSKQLDESRARIARLIAERDGLPQLEIPAEMAARLDESAIKTLLASEETQFKARANARYSQKDLLQSRVAQLGEEIAGLDAQVASKGKQLELIAGELTGVQDLYDKRLVPLTRLTTLQRETARIEGERGQLISAIAETKAKVGEAQLQIVKLDQDFRTDVVKELGETQGKEAELEQRGVAARDIIDRIELRSPTSGIVHQLSAHTIGGVIRAGDAIMEVVPDSDDLQIEARLQPNDIDQVRLGQTALIRFSAFNQRVTPQLVGLVSYVSADVSRDQQTNATYFTVRMTLPDEERRRLAGLQLVSGMPAEVFMQTGSRTMMSYLLKPITDQFNRAFVER